MNQELQNVENILQLYSFKNQLGEDIIWTQGQKEIMLPIINLGVGGKRYAQIETPTQYGKSAAIAAAILMRCTRKEQWAIVAGTADKAQIIMDYLIDYALENTIPRELLRNQVAIDKLKQERSRRHLSFSSGFEVRVFSADGRNRQATGNAIMGFGSPFVVLDEAALVDDTIEAKIFRMIAGFSATKHLYLKVGNPFYRNHFLKSHNDPDFSLTWIDYRQAIAEGRFTIEYVEKARSKPNFSILYEVKFPDSSAVDDKGWSNLLSEEDIRAIMTDEDIFGIGFLKVGCDPAGEGANFNTAVARYRNYARIIFKERLLDQFRFTERIINFKNQEKDRGALIPMQYFVDRVGVGEGHFQTMRMDLQNVVGVNVGQKGSQPEEFVNMRAEAYWRLRQDIKSKKIQLSSDEDWLQLAQIKYRTKLEGNRGKVEIMPKEDMLKNGVQSPDVADALMLTYVQLDPIETITPELVASGMEREDGFDKYAPFNFIP